MLLARRSIVDKNVSALLDAFDRMADDYGSVTLSVVGDDPEAGRFERQADSLDHVDRVSLLGFLDGYEDALGQMRAADVFASPSIREGSGITYAETMVAGCTVIDVQHPESATNGIISDMGYPAEPTVDSVAESLARVLGGKTPPARPTKRVERHDWNNVTDQTEKAYECTIGGRW